MLQLKFWLGLQWVAQLKVWADTDTELMHVTHRLTGQPHENVTCDMFVKPDTSAEENKSTGVVFQHVVWKLQAELLIYMS